MDLGLKGLNAILTGGTKGIGRAIVETLAAEGVNVAFCARNAAEVEQAKADFGKHGVRIAASVADVGDAQALKAWVQAAAASLGGIDIVVAMSARSRSPMKSRLGSAASRST